MYYFQITDDQGQTLLELSEKITNDARNVQKNLLHALAMTMVKNKVEECIVPVKLGSCFFKVYKTAASYINFSLMYGFFSTTSTELYSKLFNGLADRIYLVLVNLLGYKLLFKEDPSITIKSVKEEIQVDI